MALKLGELEVEVGANTKPLKDAEGEIKKTGKSLEMAFSKVGAAIAGALSVEASRRVVMIADNMTRLEGRVRNLTKATGDFDDVWGSLVKTANDTGVAIDGTVSSFQRFAQSKDIVNATNAEMLRFSETINKLGIISGATSNEVSATAIQIGQAMTGNFATAAQEINSIQEQMPEVARAVERSMGLATGQFKNAFSEGRSDSETFFKAVLDAAEETDKTFAGLPRTIDMAAAALSNNFALAVSEVNKQLGVTQGLSSIFDTIADSLSDFAKGVETKPLKDLQFELIAINHEQELLNKQVAQESNLREQLKKAQSGQEYAAITKQIESLSGKTERMNEIDERRIQILKEIEGITKPKQKAQEEKKEGKKVVDIDDKDQKRKEKQRAKDLVSAQNHLDSIYLASLNNKDRILAIETQALSDIDDLYLDNLISYEEAEAAKIQVGKTSAEQRAESEKQAAQEVARAYDRLNKTIADQLSSALVGTQSWADAMRAIIANLASQFIEAGLSSAFGVESSAGNVFSSAFSGGGRAMGGQTSGMLAHPINERGNPEILKMGGKQFLLPTGQNGNISPLSQGQQQQPNVSIVSMGEPQSIGAVEITPEGVRVMIDNALKGYDNRLNGQLASGTGKTAKSLQAGFNVGRNMGAK